MMRHRSGYPRRDDERSSSEEDDAFTALSRKRKESRASTNISGSCSKKLLASDGAGAAAYSGLSEDAQGSAKLPVAITSSTKRHHGEISDARKAKMDALILELEAEKNKTSSEPRLQGRGPERVRGSFVDPGDEFLTTNIFVGNLAPSITEEQMTDLFRQFGDLYSVKIMWPRTPEERSRNRHTGFVCFMNRQDAEDAMDACSEADPFNVGRQLMMRWGKNVRKAADGVPIVMKGTGGIAPRIQAKTDIENHRTAAELEASLKIDTSKSIRVVPPLDKRRANFISTVASFVAKDGEQFERMLLHQEADNPEFRFLSLSSDAALETKQENEFYKWRVYSFCQGDGFHTWRTEPFTMFQPNGCTWIPPPLDDEAARKEAEEIKRKEEEIRKQKQQRRFQSAKRGLSTGRQLEQARRGGADAGARLTDIELTEFDKLFKVQLCASRQSICQAMAFCFEKSGAAKQVASMLKDLLLQTTPGTSVETITARLYLISDVLFNSQQPGIRNAFLYRDAIERMSPDVFKSIGGFARDNFGRMSRERLASCINAIFAAWVNWGVLDPGFLDELQARFEGREIIVPKADESSDQVVEAEPEKLSRDATEVNNMSVISESLGGDWASVSADPHKPFRVGNFTDVDPDGASVEEDGEPLDDVQSTEIVQADSTLHDADGESLEGSDVGNQPSDDDHPTRLNDPVKPLDADPDGEPLDEDPDGEPLDEDPDGEPLDEDPDGEALAEDNDGGPLNKNADRDTFDDDNDGEHLEEDSDGASVEV